MMTVALTLRFAVGAAVLAMTACVGAGCSTPSSAPSLSVTPEPAGSSGEGAGGGAEHATLEAPLGLRRPSAPLYTGGAPFLAPCTTPVQDLPGDTTAVHVVTVHADRGPHASSKAVGVDRRLFGMNIADWRPQDYVPVPAPDFVAWLGALRPGVLRWPAGHASQGYVWARGGGVQTGSWELTPANLDAFVALNKAVGSEPLIGINVKRGNPSAAADLVRYLNVDHHDGVHWFYVGNEPDLGDGFASSPSTYADQLVAFADAMLAVDPSIGIVGPEMMTGADACGFQGSMDWMTPILARAGGRIAGISWHFYPLDSGQTLPTSSAIVSIPHLFQETAPDINGSGMSFVDQIMPALAATRDAHAPGASIWITEMAEDPGPAAGAGISDTQAAALWVGDALGRYAEYGPGAVVRFLFKSDGQAYALLDGDGHPHPTYGAYWLYARYFGDRFVDSASDALTDVAVHAALRSDGALTVALVNKTTSPQHVRLDVSGFCTQSASELTHSGGGALTSQTFTIEGQTLSSANVGTGIAATPLAAAHLFDTVVPAASMRLLVYR